MHETALWAAMWWADKLRRGKPGAGIGEEQAEASIGLMGLFTTGLLPGLSEEALSAFEVSLAAIIEEKIEKDPEFVIARDYNTPQCIIQAMDKAEIPLGWQINLPCKTVMKISQREIKLKDGYGQPFNTVFVGGQ